MSERLFGPDNRPVTPATEAEAQVQPVQRRGPSRRFQGVYLLMPQPMFQSLVAAHQRLMSIRRAPESFDSWIQVLIRAGADIIIPHEMAEFEAEMTETLRVLAADAEQRGDTVVLAAVATVNDMDVDEEAKQAAWKTLADAETERQKRIAAPGEPTPMGAEDEREERIVIEDPQADATQASEEEARAAQTLREALDATPEPGDRS